MPKRRQNPSDDPGTSTKIKKESIKKTEKFVKTELKSETEMSKCSNSSLEQIEQEPCPICCNDFTSTTSIATPDSCSNHIFCVDCLITWTKKAKAICPMDRANYDSVLIYENLAQKRQNKPLKVLKIDKTGKKQETENLIVSQGYISEEFEVLEYEDFEEIVGMSREQFDNLTCEFCEENDREDQLLLCDGCDAAFHLDCLENPLDQVPEGDWYCDSCLEFEIEETRDSISASRTTYMTRATSSIESNNNDASDILVANMLDAVFTQINIEPKTKSKDKKTKSKSKTKSKKKATRRKRTKNTIKRRKSKKVNLKMSKSKNSKSESSLYIGTTGKFGSSYNSDVYYHLGTFDDNLNIDNKLVDGPKPNLMPRIKGTSSKKFKLPPCPFKLKISENAVSQLEKARKGEESESFDSILKAQQDTFRKSKSKSLNNNKSKSIFQNVGYCHINSDKTSSKSKQSKPRLHNFSKFSFK